MGDKISTTASHGVLSLPIQAASFAVVRLSRASRLNTASRQEREFNFSLVKEKQELSHVRTLQKVLLCKTTGAPTARHYHPRTGRAGQAGQARMQVCGT